MENNPGLELLFEHASKYRFSDFCKLLPELLTELPDDRLGDAYLMQAQIKLFSADRSLLLDLEKSGRAGGAPRFPCLNAKWLPDSPNRFVVFNKSPASLESFAAILPRAQEVLTGLYGEAGGSMVRQVRGEIFYYTGRFNEAIDLAEEQLCKSARLGADAMLSQCTLFRCYLACGKPQRAEQCMLDMIRAAKVCPECFAPYQVIRDWANLTTGWSGDAPRFISAPHGGDIPVLEDRLNAFKSGVGENSVREASFVRCAGSLYDNKYTISRLYIDVFQAAYWFSLGDDRQSELSFMRAYDVSRASGIVMPFVEYGRQIVPLLQYMGDSGAGCAPEWIAGTMSLAQHYEESINAYRG